VQWCFTQIMPAVLLHAQVSTISGFCQQQRDGLAYLVPMDNEPLWPLLCLAVRRVEQMQYWKG
jgi:hypothetical protein